VRKPGLFRKFTFLVIFLVVATALGVGSGLSLISQQAFERTIRADYRLAAVLAGRQIEMFLDNAFQGLNGAAALVAAIRLDRWRTQMAVTELRHKFPQFEYLALLDLRGYETAGALFNQDLFSREGRAAFQEACQGRPACSQVLLSERVPVMFIAAPVFYDGRQTAVLWGRLNAKPVWDVVIQLKRDLNFGPNGHVYLLDGDKTLIAGDEISRQFGQVLDLGSPPKAAEDQPLDIEVLREAKRFDTYDPETLKSLLKDWHFQPAFWVEQWEGRKTIFVKSRIESLNWSLYLVQPYEDAFYFLRQGLWTSVGLVIMIVGAAVALTWLTTRKFLAPLARLHQGVARAARGDLSESIEVETQDEVGDLARHFNEMQAALEDYINRLVSATADLNHAKCLAVLGTTASKVNHQVGNFLNNLVLALSIVKTDHLSETSKESVAVIEENARQIQTFIERLLSFARRADLSLRAWSPEAGLKEIIETLRLQTESRRVAMTVKTEAAPLVLADKALMEQALINLLTNALEATPPGGKIVVRVRPDGERVRIDIEDTGQGIPPEDLDNVFTPFFTTKKDKGSGLGLSLVQTVIEAHGGEVALDSRVGQGTTASCWLPAAPPVAVEKH